MNPFLALFLQQIEQAAFETGVGLAKTALTEIKQATENGLKRAASHVHEQTQALPQIVEATATSSSNDSGN